jgi:hypothetical protein
MASRKPHIVLAFDVETTGGVLPVCPLGVHALEKSRPPRGDALVSIGWAGGRLKKGKGGVKVDLLAPPKRLDIDLKKPPMRSWESHWKAMGWSEVTYRKFWASRLETLEAMQASTTSFVTAAHLLNKELKGLEDQYEIIPIVDAVGYDAVWADVLLNSQGYRGLALTRTGYPRRIIDAYSYRLGLSKLGHEESAPGHDNGSEKVRGPFSRHRAVFGDMYEHPHLPDLDAKGILVSYLGAISSSPRQN